MKLDETVDDVLYSEAALLLGEVHWIILKATHAMDQKRWNEIRTSPTQAKSGL